MRVVLFKRLHRVLHFGVGVNAAGLGPSYRSSKSTPFAPSVFWRVTMNAALSEGNRYQLQGSSLYDANAM